ncbi:hypothetical protein H632_c32p2 [Helicosporidium sp. ATCC 50920]|nr:hypothetical protein H632_c32p2 [Helicosporidium sp. ATCC 50920]|eukprot:KDD77048.1 hypothetical protein H632_c32p2 [Helicosporidium sp. ATCC 50920]
MELFKFSGVRSDTHGWCKATRRFMRHRMYKVGKNDLYRKKVMYLLNHRSWADLIIDQYATEGRSTFLSRFAVALAFPAFISVMYVTKTVLLFNRNNVKDKEAFNRWIDRQFGSSPQTGLSVYPEGHRSTAGGSQPLKRGMLMYAFSRKMPVQIIISANKEALLSEKEFTARFNQNVAVGYSEVIDPSKFEDPREFVDEVQRVWDAKWNEVYSADMTKLPDLPLGPTDIMLPVSLRYAVLPLFAANIILFGLALYCIWWSLTTFLALCGPLGPFVGGLLTAYVATSLIIYSLPYDTSAAAAERKHLPKAEAVRSPTPALNGQAKDQ